MLPRYQTLYYLHIKFTKKEPETARLKKLLIAAKYKGNSTQCKKQEG
jgi:hypothetical protein